MMKSQPLEPRFWAKVSPGSLDDCWEWAAAIAASGYGVIGYEGKVITAHRASWIIHNGPIPDGLWVPHHCDNRPCVNPRHLYLGTAQDNSNDMMRRGRKVYVLKSVCKYGHALTPENIHIYVYKGVPTRNCRECARRRVRERRAKLKVSQT